jgi:hypothetical protein
MPGVRTSEKFVWRRTSKPVGPHREAYAGQSVCWVDLHPVLQFQLRSNITGAFAWNWYWRESTHDGIYAFGSGALIDPAGASHARYLGTQGDLEIRWAPMPHIIIAFNLAGFEPGAFFNTVTYNAAPIEADAGFTYRF